MIHEELPQNPAPEIAQSEPTVMPTVVGGPTPGEGEVAITDTGSSFDDTLAFEISEFTGDAARANFALTDIEGGVEFSINVVEPLADLNGVFFNLADNSLISGLSAQGTDVTDSAFGSNIDSVGNAVITPESFEAGVAIGTAGIGTDDIQSTTFTLSHTSEELNLDSFLGEAFGVRLTSVGDSRNGSSKLAGTAPTEMDSPDDGNGGETSDSVIIGISTGEFSQPSDPDDNAEIELSDVNGGTSNRFEWGVAVEDSFTSILQFDGADYFGAKSSEPFKVGQIFYRNGTIEGDTGFDGEFGFAVELDIDGLEADPAPFEFAFDILNTPNETGDPVEDADRLRFVTSGLSPQTFEFDGKTYTLELLGFSQDGGESFEEGFDSPEEGFDIASLYGKLIQVSGGDGDDDGGGGTDFSSLFVSLSSEITISLQSANAVFIGGDGSGEGAVAGSAFLSRTQLSTFWSLRTSTTIGFLNEEFTQLPEGDADLDDIDDSGEVAVGSEGDDNISGSQDSDAIVCGDGDDQVDGDGGNDHLLGQEGDDSVEGNEGNDLMNGNQGNDMVMGGDGDDIARGGQGNDMVMGGEGNDQIFGDYGDDVLIGGGGSDNFVLRTQTDINLQAALSLDFITDFEFGVDRIAIDSETSLKYEVGDFNGDGADDVGIQLEAGFLIGVVLNTTDMAAVQESVDTVPEGDFLLSAS
jgi:Ca2+-binding RTX toxin-like protein